MTDTKFGHLKVSNHGIILYAKSRPRNPDVDIYQLNPLA